MRRALEAEKTGVDNENYATNDFRRTVYVQIKLVDSLSYILDNIYPSTLLTGKNFSSSIIRRRALTFVHIDRVLDQRQFHQAVGRAY